MEEFELMQQVAERVKKALNYGTLLDGRDRYDLHIEYRPEARISSIGENDMTIKVELHPEDSAYRPRLLTITVAGEAL